MNPLSHPVWRGACEVGGMLFRHISKGRNCPQCQSGEVFRLKRTGMALRFVCNVMNLRPHWCSHCDTFFLAPKQHKSVRVAEGFELADRKASS
jgi:hypothetical protein